MDLTRLTDEPLLATIKGLPNAAIGKPLSALGGLGLSVLQDDLPFPVAVLRESSLAHNLQWMSDFAARARVSLCPHGKTTMAPQIFKHQLQAGAWGITAATPGHVRSYGQFGVERIILANQLVGRGNFDLIFDELEARPDLDLYLLIDSRAGLDLLQREARRRGVRRPLQVLLEVGAIGGRTGVRSFEDGVLLGQALRAAGPEIALRGIEAFEGIASGPDESHAELAVYAMLETVSALARVGRAQRWFAPGEVILTAGGSAFFDVVAHVLRALPETDVRVVLRSGCYVTHDSLHYARMQARMRQRAGSLWGSGPGLRNALEVWSVVQSVPEPQRAIVALGKRDVSHDLELPQPLWWFRPGQHEVPHPVPATTRMTALNDQHAFVDSSDGPIDWQVGDLVGVGVGHPCTTFDKWPVLYLVDDDYKVTGGIRTFF